MPRTKPAPSDPILYQQIKEKVKSPVSRWPSAYASGMLVKQYKAEMSRRGKAPYIGSKDLGHNSIGLGRWFDEKWIDILTGQPCGSVRTLAYYPTCRPSIRISKNTPVTSKELNSRDKASMIIQKQTAQGKRVIYTETQRKRHKDTNIQISKT